MCDTLYIFNPDNDLALAYGGVNYTAPPNAQRLRYDMQLLPLWYAMPGSAVICSNEVDYGWYNQIQSLFNIDIKCVSIEDIQNYNCQVIPWGWSADMVKRLTDRKYDRQLLPADEYVNKLRELSHRRFTINLHRELSKLVDFPLSKEPCELTDINDVLEYAGSHKNCYLKAPWSSSGRGIFQVIDAESVDFKRWTSGILRRQSSVMCEELLHKVQDFAMEFSCESGVCKFAGYSVFQCDAHRSYTGNILATDEYLQTLLTQYVPRSWLNSTKVALEKILTEKIGPFYNGYLGVDMMIHTSENGEYMLYPCIEMNLRMSMGMVARIVYDRYVKSGMVGKMNVEYFSSSQDLIQAEEQDSISKPLHTDTGKIVSGSISLNPINENTHYRCHVTIGINKT